MKLHLISIACLISGSLLTGTAVAGNGVASGEVAVSVTITAPTCTLSAPETVDMGDWGNKNFTGPGFKTNPVAFDVAIDNCSDSGLRGELHFTGASDPTSSSEFQLLTGEGKASGIALHLSKDAKGENGISPDGDGDPVDLPAVGATGIIKTWASYIQTQDSVTPGKAEATVTIELVYL